MVVVVVVVGGWGWVRGASHAVAEARLGGLAVAGRGCVSIAVGLLGGHGYVGARCEHELGCAVNDGLGLCGLLLLFPQGLGGLKLVNLGVISLADGWDHS